MPRIRSIKPSFWTDEKVGQLPHGGRLLFLGLWTYADDEGRLKLNLTELKVQLFPYDATLRSSDLQMWLEQLIALGMVQKYAVRDNEVLIDYLFVRNLTRHQKIDHPTPSKLPAPPVLSDKPDSRAASRKFASSRAGGEGKGVGRGLGLEKNKEEKLGKEESSQLSAAAAFQAYEKNIGLLTPIISEKLMAWEADTSVEWVCDAIAEAATYNKRSMAYIEGCLKNWLENGRRPKGGKNERTGSIKREYTDEERQAAIGAPLR